MRMKFYLSPRLVPMHCVRESGIQQQFQARSWAQTEEKKREREKTRETCWIVHEDREDREEGLERLVVLSTRTEKTESKNQRALSDCP